MSASLTSPAASDSNSWQQVGLDTHISEVASDVNIPEVVLDPEDPISRLENQIGQVVNYFGGENARKMIRESMDQDRANGLNLKKMENRLRELGDIDDAYKVVKHVKDTSSHCLRQVLPMRDCISEIASLLDELADPEIHTDERVLVKVMHDVHDMAKEAGDIAIAGKNKFEELSTEIRRIEVKYNAREKAEESKAKDHERLAKTKLEEARTEAQSACANSVMAGVSSLVPLGKGGIGIAAAAGGAEAVASIPLLGGALTTTTTTAVNAGGIAGWFGATTAVTTVAFSPVGIMVGTGFAVAFGLGAIKMTVDAYRSSDASKRAEAEKKVAQGKAEECRTMVKQCEETRDLASKMVDTAGCHEQLWTGLEMSAENAAFHFKKLQNSDLAGRRRSSFERNMKAYRESLVLFIQAIDEYVFFLSKTPYFPPNFCLQKKLGQQRYAELERQWNHLAPSLGDKANV
mmetsp:Transcript_4582/g.10734  ORF Transcript_4582/g.10734 Transcript_4582/m.10734 type:complete len:461 (+) Transcript_4582:71-1453(+)